MGVGGRSTHLDKQHAGAWKGGGAFSLWKVLQIAKAVVLAARLYTPLEHIRECDGRGELSTPLEKIESANGGKGVGPGRPRLFFRRS